MELIGGGVALALATDWKVCAAGTTFNFGNLPRGRHPLFMLSRSMHLNVGKGLANQLYLEDPVVTAEQAATVGLVNLIAGSVDETKRLAAVHGSKLVLKKAIFMHGNRNLSMC